MSTSLTFKWNTLLSFADLSAMGTLLSLCLGNDESHVGHAQMKRQRQKQIQQQRKQQQKEHKTFKRDQRSKSMAGGLRPTLSVPSNGGQQSQPRRASLNRLTESPPESPNRKLSLPANSPVGNSPTSPDSRSFNYERDSRKSLKREGSGGGGKKYSLPGRMNGGGTGGGRKHIMQRSMSTAR